MDYIYIKHATITYRAGERQSNAEQASGETAAHNRNASVPNTASCANIGPWIIPREAKLDEKMIALPASGTF
jgi:hypothetical protein